MRGVTLSVVLTLLSTGQPTAGLPNIGDDSKDYDDYEGHEGANAVENDADKETRSFPTPKFISESSHILVNEGDTVRLPCLVDRLEWFVIMWKQEAAILSVMHQVIDQRFRLDDVENQGNYLVLGQVSPEDQGSYTCQIMSGVTPTEIVHNMTVRTAPEIRLEDDTEEITIREGESFSLGCQATAGSPPPDLAWDADPEAVTGVQVMRAGDTLRLTVAEVTREMAGQLSCSADNGFQDTPVKKTVKVNVEYPPSIEISEAFIVTDLAEEQEIQCSVSAWPPVVEVEWNHNGVSLTELSGQVVISSLDSVFSLTIPEVNTSSVGEYTCTATNSVGSGSGTALVTGEAEPVTITNESSESEHEDRFSLTWEVTSRSAVDRWVLGLRVAGAEDWEFTEVELASAEAGNWTHDDNTTEAEALEAGQYRGSLELTSLQPGTEYEVTVATSNSFGLGQHGDIYTFSTRPRVTTQEPSPASASADASPRDSVLTSGGGADIRGLGPVIVAIACLLVSCKQ